MGTAATPIGDVIVYRHTSEDASEDASTSQRQPLCPCRAHLGGPALAKQQRPSIPAAHFGISHSFFG
ncbi:hypothetical protein EYF80_027045 [Liparis tanakae]|uniref:Uncharacterized protein n=1 Tax=Liparis tanakae TaxID=230148 RepID=A0A4Z2HCG5_9TELE|nr:hypothetical protein EYF80_027045 [Liparis tanakae]